MPTCSGSRRPSTIRASSRCSGGYRRPRAAVLSGDFTVNGFRNRDLQGKLYSAAATDVADAKRRTHQTSRLIAKLRGHGLITGVKNSRLYRLTTKGFKAMWPAVRFRRIDFPTAFRAVQTA